VARGRQKISGKTATTKGRGAKEISTPRYKTNRLKIRSREKGKNPKFLSIKTNQDWSNGKK
jgi:hypothetical protein